MLANLVLMLFIIHPDTSQVELPQKAKEALDIALTVDWTLSQQDFHKCDFNGDGLPDYAVKVSVGKGNCLVEYYVALVADSDGYGFYLLDTRPAWMRIKPDKIKLMHKGESVPDVETLDQDIPGKIVWEADAIVFIPYDGCCETAFIFRNGRFHLLTISD